MYVVSPVTKNWQMLSPFLIESYSTLPKSHDLTLMTSSLSFKSSSNELVPLNLLMTKFDDHSSCCHRFLDFSQSYVILQWSYYQYLSNWPDFNWCLFCWWLLYNVCWKEVVAFYQSHVVLEWWRHQQTSN